MLYPVMPTTAREIHQQLGLADDVGKIDAATLRWGGLPEGVQIQEVKPLFPRIDKAKTMEEIREQKSEVRSQKSEEAETRPSGRVQGSEESKTVAQGSGQHTTEADAVPGVACYIDITD